MSATSLERARAVERPTREAMLQRAPSVHQFWDQNKALFQTAWKEWETSEGDAKLSLGSELIHKDLRVAVENAWADPTAEADVRKQWKEVFPGVYQTQFFDPEKLKDLRTYMDAVSKVEIPLRPPYGIVLNRGGAMLDPRSEGYLAAPEFQAFYSTLMDRYMRPVSRLLFPDVPGYDTQTFGFSIQWQENKDTSLRPHTDASSVTLNINLNLPGEDFSGSGVSFFDRETGKVQELNFEPGMALIHHGSVPHASQPITKGERYNFILWLYGDHGEIPPVGAPVPALNAQQRWSLPDTKSDGFAPF